MTLQKYMQDNPDTTEGERSSGGWAHKQSKCKPRLKTPNTLRIQSLQPDDVLGWFQAMVARPMLSVGCPHSNNVGKMQKHEKGHYVKRKKKEFDSKTKHDLLKWKHYRACNSFYINMCYSQWMPIQTHAFTLSIAQHTGTVILTSPIALL